MSAEEQTQILAAYIQARFPNEITGGGVGEVAVRILEKYLPDNPQPQVPDENIVAEIRMPDCDGNVCLTFILDRQGNVTCWPDFGDPVRVDPEILQAVAGAISVLTELCVLRPEEGEWVKIR